jgi:hypothetical protein
MHKVPKDFIDNPYWTFKGTEAQANAFGLAACIALALKSSDQIEDFFARYEISRSDRKPWQTDLVMLWSYLTFLQPEDEEVRQETRAFLANFHFKDRFIETQLKQESNLFDEDIPTSDELLDWYTEH